MMSNRRIRHLSVCLGISMPLALGACSSSEPSSPKASTSKSSASDGAEAAKSVLEKGIIEMDSLNGGSGVLKRNVGNTLASVPDDVVSVAFAFTCIGGEKVELTLTTSGKDAASGTVVCDGSIFQRSINTAESGPVAFSAVTADGSSGGYAYAYYVEKKNES
ncbi:hypothetical protein ACFC5X_13575 [Streptomyces sp. NPDC055952]|uniref:hypothetical protein n=1 Tax=Streptomyces sp. NPDC055952 TaxID=3345663 RepID=UPI0035D72CC4